RGKARNFVSPKRKGDASMARMEDVPVAGKDCDAAADRANLAVPLAGRVLHGLEAGARARLADGAKPAARGLERRAEVAREIGRPGRAELAADREERAREPDQAAGLVLEPAQRQLGAAVGALARVRGDTVLARNPARRR